MNRIVIIDDELNICESICFAVQKAGFECSYFTDPLKGITHLESSLPDLVILDIIMPSLDGLEICRSLRKLSETLPIIFLSSKDEEFDRVLGLEMGADDYLCKPFSMKELIARIRVNLRRSGYLKKELKESGESIQHGPFTINEESYSAEFYGRSIKLTVTEFRILHGLISEPGIVKTREQLLNRAFPFDYHVGDRTIDTHIKRIRKKLTAVNPDVSPIETVFGVGYKLKS